MPEGDADKAWRRPYDLHRQLPTDNHAKRHAFERWREWMEGDRTMKAEIGDTTVDAQGQTRIQSVIISDGENVVGVLELSKPLSDVTAVMGALVELTASL